MGPSLSLSHSLGLKSKLFLLPSSSIDDVCWWYCIWQQLSDVGLWPRVQRILGEEALGREVWKHKLNMPLPKPAGELDPSCQMPLCHFESVQLTPNFGVSETHAALEQPLSDLTAGAADVSLPSSGAETVGVPQMPSDAALGNTQSDVSASADVSSSAGAGEGHGGLGVEDNEVGAQHCDAGDPDDEDEFRGGRRTTFHTVCAGSINRLFRDARSGPRKMVEALVQGAHQLQQIVHEMARCFYEKEFERLQAETKTQCKHDWDLPKPPRPSMVYLAAVFALALRTVRDAGGHPMCAHDIPERDRQHFFNAGDLGKVALNPHVVDFMLELLRQEGAEQVLQCCTPFDVGRVDKLVHDCDCPPLHWRSEMSGHRALDYEKNVGDIIEQRFWGWVRCWVSMVHDSPDGYGAKWPPDHGSAVPRETRWWQGRNNERTKAIVSNFMYALNHILQSEEGEKLCKDGNPRDLDAFFSDVAVADCSNTVEAKQCYVQEGHGIGQHFRNLFGPALKEHFEAAAVSGDGHKSSKKRKRSQGQADEGSHSDALDEDAEGKTLTSLLYQKQKKGVSHSNKCWELFLWPSLYIQQALGRYTISTHPDLATPPGTVPGGVSEAGTGGVEAPPPNPPHSAQRKEAGFRSHRVLPQLDKSVPGFLLISPPILCQMFETADRRRREQAEELKRLKANSNASKAALRACSRKLGHRRGSLPAAPNPPDVSLVEGVAKQRPQPTWARLYRTALKAPHRCVELIIPNWHSLLRAVPAGSRGPYRMGREGVCSSISTDGRRVTLMYTRAPKRDTRVRRTDCKYGAQGAKRAKGAEGAEGAGKPNVDCQDRLRSRDEYMGKMSRGLKFKLHAGRWPGHEGVYVGPEASFSQKEKALQTDPRRVQERLSPMILVDPGDRRPFFCWDISSDPCIKELFQGPRELGSQAAPNPTINKGQHKLNRKNAFCVRLSRGPSKRSSAGQGAPVDHHEADRTSDAPDGAPMSSAKLRRRRWILRKQSREAIEQGPNVPRCCSTREAPSIPPPFQGPAKPPHPRLVQQWTSVLGQVINKHRVDALRRVAPTAEPGTVTGTAEATTPKAPPLGSTVPLMDHPPATRLSPFAERVLARIPLNWHYASLRWRRLHFKAFIHRQKREAHIRLRFLKHFGLLNAQCGHRRDIREQNRPRVPEEHGAAPAGGATPPTARGPYKERRRLRKRMRNLRNRTLVIIGTGGPGAFTTSSPGHYSRKRQRHPLPLKRFRDNLVRGGIKAAYMNENLTSQVCPRCMVRDILRQDTLSNAQSSHAVAPSRPSAEAKYLENLPKEKMPRPPRLPPRLAGGGAVLGQQEPTTPESRGGVGVRGQQKPKTPWGLKWHPACNTVWDRDVSACINMAIKALRLLAGKTCPRDLRPRIRPRPPPAAGGQVGAPAQPPSPARPGTTRSGRQWKRPQTLAADDHPDAVPTTTVSGRPVKKPRRLGDD